MKIYISHTAKCTGWDVGALYKKYSISLGARTMRFNSEEDIKMLDWDYREFTKNPEKLREKHLEIARDYDFDVVMSMDLFENNVSEALEYADMLLKYQDKVLIPVHHYDPRILDYDLAYPNANWFCKNRLPPPKYCGNIKHILGGSPQSQLRLIRMNQKTLDFNGLNIIKFMNIESIDGNQIFNVATFFGRYWKNKKPYWFKPKVKKTNFECFEISLKNVRYEIEWMKKKSINNFNDKIPQLKEENRKYAEKIRRNRKITTETLFRKFDI